MKKQIKKIALDTNLFLKFFLKKQKKNRTNQTYKIWIISRGKEN